MGKVFVTKVGKGKQPRVTVDKKLAGKTIAYTPIDSALAKLAKELRGGK